MEKRIINKKDLSKYEVLETIEGAITHYDPPSIMDDGGPVRESLPSLLWDGRSGVWRLIDPDERIYQELSPNEKGKYVKLLKKRLMAKVASAVMDETLFLATMICGEKAGKQQIWGGCKKSAQFTTDNFGKPVVS
ncbi:MAG: hypothetical protein SV375_14450 [Thermodesulfobacteriota bacterium]|nr:hypothetical protein [Thermodesulfobacteriota bacterium]